VNENEIYSVDFTRSLPPPLKDDPEMFALAKSIAAQLHSMTQQIRRNVIYARIDELDEQTLDILAYDLHVDWYDYSYPIEVKRRTIKDSVRVHMRLGTKYAVETALGAVFPGTQITEWFEYGGNPYTFRVTVNLTDSDILTLAKHREVFARLNFYKNLRSHLDEVRYILKPEKAWATAGGGFTGSKGTDHAFIIVPPLRKPGGTALQIAGGGFTGTQETKRVAIIPPELERPGGKTIVIACGCFTGTREADGVSIILPELEKPGGGALTVAGGAIIGTRQEDHATIKPPPLHTPGGTAGVSTGGAVLAVRRKIVSIVKPPPLRKPTGLAETAASAGTVGSYRKLSVPINVRGAARIHAGHAAAGGATGVFHTYQRMEVFVQTNL